jgi:hypothetical protein
VLHRSALLQQQRTERMSDRLHPTPQLVVGGVNARCLDEIDVAALQPSRFFDGRNWEAAFAARQASGS